MLLQINYLHLTFFLKKINLISFNNIQIDYVYSIMVKNSHFFLLIAQRFIFSIQTKIKPKLAFIFKLKIASKTIFNLLLMEVLNLIQCLKLIKSCNFYNFCKKQTNYTVLRAPFVFKNSREQFCFDTYIGSFITEFYINTFLIVDFMEVSFFKFLKHFFLFDLKAIKKISII
jgi:hypothetical protein